MGEAPSWEECGEEQSLPPQCPASALQVPWPLRRKGAGRWQAARAQLPITLQMSTGAWRMQEDSGEKGGAHISVSIQV